MGSRSVIVAQVRIEGATERGCMEHDHMVCALSPKILRHAESASMATAVTTPPDHQSAPFSEAAGPCAMVLFGASGDLTKRKLAPALFNLAKVSLLPKNFAILGVAIEQLGDEQF